MSYYSWTSIPQLRLYSLNELHTRLSTERSVRNDQSYNALPTIPSRGMPVASSLLDTFREATRYLVQYGSSSAFEWTNANSSAATVLEAHLKELQQVVDDAHAMARCYQTCSAQCGRACDDVACRSSCSATCSSVCRNAVCDSQCTSQCYTACLGTCASTTCQGGCYGGCSGGCGTTCVNGCYGNQWSYTMGCGYYCEGTCNSACTGGCLFGCAGTCSVNGG